MIVSFAALSFLQKNRFLSEVSLFLFQPSFTWDLLVCLRAVHASQTLHFIRILVEMYFDSCHLWVVQMAELEIRKKLEMLSCSGQKKVIFRLSRLAFIFRLFRVFHSYLEITNFIHL